MEVIQSGDVRLAQPGGFSVVLAERVLGMADALGLPEKWRELGFGNPTRRTTAYTTDRRIAAVVAGLACGLRGIAPGNMLVRPNQAMQQRLGGRFPDQGTIHRWLGRITEAQAADLRRHLQEVVREQGRFWQELWWKRWLVVDMDGQGLIARGQRFERAHGGYLGGSIDCGYQRYVCYAAATREVLDELLVPGNRTAMSVLPEMLEGLNEVIPVKDRSRVLLRGDAHFGTAKNVWQMRRAGYHFLCPLHNPWSRKKLKEHVQNWKGGWLEVTDSAGVTQRLHFWRVPRWEMHVKDSPKRVRCRATVYCKQEANGREEWTVLITDLKRFSARQMWETYTERCGSIEEYNDQSERAYHLDVMRTGNLAGLNAVQCLVGLCWNLTRWATEELTLPPVLAPAADPASWLRAADMDLEHLMQRAQNSGLRLYRETAAGPLEVEDTASTPESAAWLRSLQRPVQRRLRLAG